MGKKLLVVGCGISQLPTFERAKELGVTTIGIDGSIDAMAKGKADYFEVADIKDPQEVLSIAKDYKIDGIVVPGTDFPVTGSFVAQELDLPGINLETAKICSNKYLQRKFLKEKGFLVPSFLEFNSFIPNLIRHKLKDEKINGRCLIKPVDNMAARGVKAFDISKISNTELETLCANSMAFSRSGKFIIEEFVEGMEFSIDSLVYDGEVYIFAFADRHFSLYPYMIEVGHTMPSIVSKNTQFDVNKVFIEAVKALGINNGAAKGDVKITDKGVFIGEIAARISGGYLSGWTTPLTTGYYPHDDLIKISLGEKPEFPRLSTKGYSAERVFLSFTGEVKEIIQTKKTKCVREIQFYKKPGAKIHYPKNNALRAGSVITYSKEGRDEAIFYAQDTVKNYVIRLCPNNIITESDILDNEATMFEPGKTEVDWEGRDIEFALKQVQAITGVRSFLNMPEKFWKMFYKGGVQGGIYFIDSNT
jgi:biotin carboxylase